LIGHKNKVLGLEVRGNILAERFGNVVTDHHLGGQIQLTLPCARFTQIHQGFALGVEQLNNPHPRVSYVNDVVTIYANAPGAREVSGCASRLAEQEGRLTVLIDLLDAQIH